MKKTLRNIIFSIVLCFSVFLLTSCGGGIQGSEAKAHINEFFTAIVDEDYSKAETLLHPERSADLENFFVNVEAKKTLIFKKA